MIDYRIECEECDNTSYAATFEKPYYCPCCGRRAEVELVDEAEELNFD
jgi:Zn finger protein HypA/HybF involved in hydrogenase expression